MSIFGTILVFYLLISTLRIIAKQRNIEEWNVPKKVALNIYLATFANSTGDMLPKVVCSRLRL